ncbi:hypothetical protein SLA_2152 [Streptomyces laurentii]|uniref:Uncharacterized protein n=1 Tax=Streptomyces laurentii TaxID=39478 RepID=A0A160NY77_STRLU|nr:hypothetical protein SLA_2152 [Streptomyces laurentii]
MCEARGYARAGAHPLRAPYRLVPFRAGRAQARTDLSAPAPPQPSPPPVVDPKPVQGLSAG